VDSSFAAIFSLEERTIEPFGGVPYFIKAALPLSGKAVWEPTNMDTLKNEWGRTWGQTKFRYLGVDFPVFGREVKGHSQAVASRI